MDIGKVVSAIVIFFLGIIEFLLGARFLLLLLNASTSASFTQTVYEASIPLVAPFEGVFPAPEVAGFVLEIPTALAMLVYGIVGVLILVMVRKFEGTKVNPKLGSNNPQQPMFGGGQPQQPVQQQPIVQQPVMHGQQPHQPMQQPMQGQPMQPSQPYGSQQYQNPAAQMGQDNNNPQQMDGRSQSVYQHPQSGNNSPDNS